MSRYIDLDNSECVYCGNDGDYEKWNIPDDMPTADVVPVRHGYWKGKPLAGYSTVRCSVCDSIFRENSGRWKYCPDCGATMDERVDE